MSLDPLFNAIARRDPSKRQIKPVNTDQLTLFDDLDDDSDSEYVCDDKEEGDEDDIESQSSGDESAASEFTTHSSVTSANSVSKVDLGFVPKVAESVEPINSNKNRPEENDEIAATHDLRGGLEVKHEDLNIMICMLCLGDGEDPNDELIECDGCGVVVHEDCYKVVDSIFLSSGASSSSTDAWFCEPCLAGVSSPACELCPVLDGVFKRTDNNRWVHLLCALYTPGVAFNDPDNLLDVTLTELPQRHWSLHECSLCEDRFFAWTGVCISCDAGLCRTFFHVTCAQKHGLLSEPTIDESPADPFFAHCRQHTDKTVARHRRRNFLTAMHRLKTWRSKQAELSATSPFDFKVSHLVNENQPKFDPRLQRKLDSYREVYESLRRRRDKPYVPLIKTPLFLETSPVAMRLFVTKAKTLNLPIDLSNNLTNTDLKVPTPGYPVFAPEFISYFFEREKKIAEVSKLISTLQNTQRELQISDASASHSYNSVTAELDKITTQRVQLRSRFKFIMDVLRNILPDLRYSSELETTLTNFDSLSQTNVGLNSTISHSNCDNNNNNNRNNTNVFNILKRRNPHLLSPPSKVCRYSKLVNGKNTFETGNNLIENNSGNQNSNHEFKTESVILECIVCHGLQDQHLITSCDTCAKAFHLACLDPPLLRMPKRSRLYGWQCSYCTKEVASITEIDQIDVNAPRQLRHSSSVNTSNVITNNNNNNDVNSSSTNQTKPTVTEESSSVSKVITSPSGRSSTTEATIKIEENAKLKIKTTTTAVKRNVSSQKKRSRLNKNELKTTIISVDNYEVYTSVNNNNNNNPCDISSSNLIQVPINNKTTRKKIVHSPNIARDLQINLSSDLASSPSVVVTQFSTKDSDRYKLNDEDHMIIEDRNNFKKELDSDEEMAQLRVSKVIKFVQIRDHESNDESDLVEHIAPIQQRYMICQSGNNSNQNSNNSTNSNNNNNNNNLKKSTSGKFRLKFKKL